MFQDHYVISSKTFMTVKLRLDGGTWNVRLFYVYVWWRPRLPTKYINLIRYRIPSLHASSLGLVLCRRFPTSRCLWQQLMASAKSSLRYSQPTTNSFCPWFQWYGRHTVFYWSWTNQWRLYFNLSIPKNILSMLWFKLHLEKLFAQYESSWESLNSRSRPVGFHCFSSLSYYSPRRHKIRSKEMRKLLYRLESY